MPIAIVVLAGSLLGVALRKLRVQRFSLLFRAHLGFIIGPLAFLAGWTLEWTFRAVAMLLGVLAVEVLAMLFGIALFHQRRLSALPAVGGVSNTGYWGLPVAATLSGPPGIAIVVAYDTLVLVRGLIQVGFLRAGAPVVQQARTLAIDFIQPIAFAAGLATAAATSPPLASNGIMTALGLISGMLGVAVLFLAAPRQFPSLQTLVEATPVLPLRFLPLTILLALLAGVGVPIEPAYWILAVAPAPFSLMSFARLYGYDPELAGAIVIETIAVAAPLTVIVAIVTT